MRGLLVAGGAGRVSEEAAVRAVRVLEGAIASAEAVGFARRELQFARGARAARRAGALVSDTAAEAATAAVDVLVLEERALRPLTSEPLLRRLPCTFEVLFFFLGSFVTSYHHALFSLQSPFLLRCALPCPFHSYSTCKSPLALVVSTHFELNALLPSS
jgi:hypothetical protein